MSSAYPETLIDLRQAAGTSRAVEGRLRKQIIRLEIEIHQFKLNQDPSREGVKHILLQPELREKPEFEFISWWQKRSNLLHLFIEFHCPSLNDSLWAGAVLCQKTIGLHKYYANGKQRIKGRRSLLKHLSWRRLNPHVLRRRE